MAGRVSRHLWEEREGGSSCLVVPTSSPGVPEELLRD